MFNSVVLDVVIGLVFIYLLYSLLVTIIQEMIATVFNFRAKILQRAIVRMLEDEDKFKSAFTSLTHLFKLKGNLGGKHSLSYDFYNHPLIKFLGENKRHSAPAHIDKETFSKVLTDLLRGEIVRPGDDVVPMIQQSLDDKKIKWGTSGIGDQTLSYLNSLWADAKGDVSKFKESLEHWFEETMERTTGWYKRHTQFIVFMVGLAIVILFNVDTLKIVSKLEKDPKVREQIVQQADVFTKSHPDINREIALLKGKLQNVTGANADSAEMKQLALASDLEQLELLKEHESKLYNRADSLIRADISKTNGLLGIGWQPEQFSSIDLPGIGKSLLGWLITALAISLGAPFWFDLLTKLMKLRNPSADSNPKNNPKQSTV
ncbi:MAG: hypothetical protein WCP08_09425 [Prolixibacteraceae bacterium]